MSATHAPDRPGIRRPLCDDSGAQPEDVDLTDPPTCWECRSILGLPEEGHRDPAAEAAAPGEGEPPIMGWLSCRYVYLGLDDGTHWYRCTVHDRENMGKEVSCEGAADAAQAEEVAG